MRNDLALHVVHLDHQARGQQSADDARFVEELAREWNLPCTSARREQIEPSLIDLPANLSARFRALRFALFSNVVRDQRLNGVILAHHADDQAETVFQRLLRGSGYAGLAGMAVEARVGELVILRPLLSIRRSVLREYLEQQKLQWREDQSNQSDKYQRNRLRRELERHPELVDEMLELGSACSALRDWARAGAPVLGEKFRATELARLPGILADESARGWLIERGVPIDQIEPEGIGRLVTMAADAATTSRLDFPGGVHVRRRAGVIGAEIRTETSDPVDRR
jgi:tRNA(Ile)-lysidine synthase